MPPEYTQLASDLMKLLIGLGAMYGTIKAGLKSLADDVKEIKLDLKEVNKTVIVHGASIAVLEAWQAIDRKK